MHIPPLYKTFCIAVTLLVLISCNSSPDRKDGVTTNNPELPGQGKSTLVSGVAAEEEMRQAALNGEVEQVKAYIDAGTNVNALDQEGHTALMFAGYNGHTKIVIMLIEEDAVVDRRDLLGQTALLYASSGQFPETVKVLLDKGAEPDIVDSNEHFTPLMHAATAGNLDVVKLLITHGADLSMTDVDGDDAESFARQAGHLKVAEYLQSLR